MPGGIESNVLRSLAKVLTVAESPSICWYSKFFELWFASR